MSATLFSAAFIDSIFTQSPNPMWISDDRGTLIRLNQACRDLLNISEADVVGIYNILQDNIVADQGVLPLVRRVFEQGETVRFEIRYDSSQLEHLRLSNYASVHLDVTVFPIKDVQQRVTNAVIQHINITAQRQAEEALQRANADLEARVQEGAAAHRAAEELFRTLCESAPIGIYMTDTSGNCAYSNPRLTEISGILPDESLGSGWLNMVHPEDREETRRIWSDAFDAGEPYAQEYRVLTPQGRTRWVRSLARAIQGDAGRPINYVGTLEDITELRHAEGEMLKAQKLESLGVLAGGIAHDFNNVLMIILGYLSLARSKVQDPKVALQLLDEGEKAIMRAKGLTQQLLTFARGGVPIKRVLLLNDLLQEASGFASLGTNVSCDFQLANDLLPVQADEGQLTQVIQNLVINAVQSMPEGGSVTVLSENVTYPRTEGASVKFTIRDTGTGISSQHLSKIFDPYFSTKQQGSGLGLASCYAIVTKHDGQITVDSVLGKGSSFTVCLPAARPEEKPDHQLRKAEHRGQGRILLMDDEASIRGIGRAMLEELGYFAECAKDGSEAIELYRQRKEEGVPFDAVIMDLTVPGGLGGKDAVAALLLSDPGINAIVSSGYSDDPILARCNEYGFCAVLSKPYTQQEISKVLHEVLKGRPSSPPIEAEGDAAKNLRGRALTCE